MANVNYAPRSPLCPNCMEFIYRTWRYFRLIAAQTETSAAILAVGLYQAFHTHATVDLSHLPQAATCLSTGV